MIDAFKAAIIADETSVLDDAQAAQAEALIAGQLAGKTAGQIRRLAAVAVVAVDPAGAQRRRERAERETARVQFWRERTGTSALAAYGLPTDAALSANANIAARARQYKQARLDATMDQLRVLAFLDIINGITAANRIAQARAGQAAQAADTPPADTQPAASPGRPGGTAGQPGCDDSGTATAPGAEDAPVPGDTPGQDDSGIGTCAGWGGPADDSTGQPGAGAAAGGDTGPVLAASTNLTIPLATLLGLADRPGEGHGLGPLDPALARHLAAAAARSPHSNWHITITNPDGIAIGHGCARKTRTRAKPGNWRGRHPPPGSGTSWAFTRRGGSGPPDGYGSWTLTLAGGRELAVDLHPIPVYDCDHRYQTHAYQPGDLLRHLVQVRDGECTFPCCSRLARESDFEHAIPYDRGGRTCACNAGARSRRCHKVKQSKGWKLTQPRPGWHQWTTPSGRTLTQGPKKYPA